MNIENIPNPKTFSEPTSLYNFQEMARTKSSARKLIVPAPRLPTDFTPELLAALPSILELQHIHNMLVPRDPAADDNARGPELFELLFFLCCWIAHYKSTDLPESRNQIYTLDKLAVQTSGALMDNDLYRLVRSCAIELDENISQPHEVPLIMSIRTYLYYRRLMTHLSRNLEGKPSLTMSVLKSYVPILFIEGLFYWSYLIENRQSFKQTRTLSLAPKVPEPVDDEPELCFHDDHLCVVSSTNDAVEAASAFATLAHVNPAAQVVCSECHVLQSEAPTCVACSASLEQPEPCTPLFANKPGACIGGSHFNKADNGPISKRRKIVVE